jgi:hypothetical protein
MGELGEGVLGHTKILSVKKKYWGTMTTVQ